MKTILVVDFGGQYAHLLAQRIRKLWVHSEIISPSNDILQIENVWGIILSWWPHSVNDLSAPKLHPHILKMNSDEWVPILGICYGHQLIAQTLWGQVETWTSTEYGKATIQTEQTSSLTDSVDDTIMRMSHGDSVSRLPEWYSVLWSTKECPIAIMWSETKNIYGVQFHPEVTHSEWGDRLLSNFLFDICALTPSRTASSQVERIQQDIRAKAGNKNVFMLVSWWVDSMVCFALLNSVLWADRVHWLCIDTWMMRKNEIHDVKETLTGLWWGNMSIVDASSVFLDALQWISDPEQKRKAIGETFLTVQQSEVTKMNVDPTQRILWQWTIYPDIIESQGTENSHLIKTHHNRVAGIQALIEQWQVIEPLAELYKDEVRNVWEQIWLPSDIVQRHPFPGPGLWIRILCHLEGDSANQDSSFSSDVTPPSHLQDILCSYLVAPFHSVWVQWDGRTYRNPCIIIENESPLDRDLLEKISTETINYSSVINRCILWCWWVSPAESEIKNLEVDRSSVALLQKADALVMQRMIKNNLLSNIRQMPVVLLPRWGRKEGWYSVVLRPVNSTEAMTASFSKIEKKLVNEITHELCSLAWIDAVYYDITNKPPGTIERE